MPVFFGTALFALLGLAVIGGFTAMFGPFAIPPLAIVLLVLLALGGRARRRDHEQAEEQPDGPQERWRARFEAANS